MAKIEIEDQIQARIESFTAELADLIRQAALQSVSEALSSPLASGRRVARLPIRMNSAALATRAGRVIADRAAGAKRSPAELEEVTERLVEFIGQNPGQRTEQIGASLGLATKDLVLPMRKLVREGRLKTKGQKRATTYYVK